jgi:hypothetical protein
MQNRLVGVRQRGRKRDKSMARFATDSVHCSSSCGGVLTGVVGHPFPIHRPNADQVWPAGVRLQQQQQQDGSFMCLGIAR